MYVKDLIIKTKYMVKQSDETKYVINTLKQVLKSSNIKKQLEKTYLSLQYNSQNSLSNIEGDLDIVGTYVKSKPIIFFLHGGGWMMGSSKDHADFIYGLAETLPVFSYNYTLGKYPDSLEDCFLMYKDLLNYKSPIYVIGLSAGATMALQIALLCKKTNIVMPKGVIAISPLTDNSLPYYKTFIDWITEKRLHNVINTYIKGFSHVNKKSIYYDQYILNPIKGDYTLTCPIYIFTCSGNIPYPKPGYWDQGELIYRDNINLYKRLTKTQHLKYIKLYQYKHLFHCFVLFPKYIMEARDVIDKIQTICK